MTPDLLPNFGKYIGVQRLGEGGFGEVYRAIDTTLNRPVALKVPHRELLRNPVFAAQFRAEAQTAAQLEHPNIVRIYSVGEFEEIPFIEMELVEGQTLADLIRAKGRLTPEEALAILQPVCAALDEAHRKGIIHSDIKPSNILIRASDGRVLVSDFGLAKSRENSFQASLSSSSVVVGTFRYMPPEQANPKLGAIGPASDVYSLGVVLYEMLTGRVPFESKSVGQLIYQHTSEDPEPPSHININLTRSVESVVLKALAKHSEARYPSAGALYQAMCTAVNPRSAAMSTLTHLYQTMGTSVNLSVLTKRIATQAPHLQLPVWKPAFRPSPPPAGSRPTTDSWTDDVLEPLADALPSPVGNGRQGAVPSSRNVSIGVLLELLGWVGLLGIGWLYMGETRTGLCLLGGWLLLGILARAVTISSFGLGLLCLMPVVIVGPIYSAIRLHKRFGNPRGATESRRSR